MGVKYLKKNELRVIKLPRKAIEEIIWESFMETGRELLDLDANSDDVIFHMAVDKTMSELVFYACSLSMPQHPSDINRINEYLKNSIGITAESVFVNSSACKLFQTIYVSDDSFMPHNDEQSNKQ